MSALGDYGRRLQTDIGDLARAVVDPVYAQQLAEANFEDRRFQRDRKIALEDAENSRKTALADEAYRQQGLIQLKLVGEGLTTIKDGFGYESLTTIMQSPKLQPHVKEYGEGLIRAQLHVNPESIYQANADQRAAKSLSNDDARLVLSQDRFDDEKTRNQRDYLFNKAKFDYEKAVDLRNEEKSVINRDQWLNHILATKGIFTGDELEEARAVMRRGDENQVKAVWDNLWKRANARTSAQTQKEVAAIKGEGMVPSAVTSVEFSEASEVLRSRIKKDIASSPEMEKLLDPGWLRILFTGATNKTGEENRKSMVFTAARVAKTFARDVTKGASENELSGAYDLAKAVGQEVIGGEPIINETKVIAYARRITNAGYTISEVMRNIEEDPRSLTVEEYLKELGI